VELKGTLTYGMTVTDFRDAYGRAHNTRWRPSSTSTASGTWWSTPSPQSVEPARSPRPPLLDRGTGWGGVSLAGARRGRL
jgi:hypothetical protein